MSAVRPSRTTPGTFLCPRCGNTLRGDQSWCLECGLAARTRVHPPPSWRLPVLLTCVLLALLAAGIAVTLVTLLDTPESTPAPATVTVPATTPSAATTPTTPEATSTPTTPTTPTTTTTPGAGRAPTTTPSGGGAQRTFTIPGTRITLPANAD